jgi:hypothetical protein
LNRSTLHRLGKVVDIELRQGIPADDQAVALGNTGPQQAQNGGEKLKAGRLAIAVLRHSRRKGPGAVAKVDLPNLFGTEREGVELLMQHGTDPQRLDLVRAEGHA